MPAHDSVTITECWARDGLQNQDEVVPTELKVKFIEACADAGLRSIEVTSFAHPKYLPQFADAEEVLRPVRRRPGVSLIAFVPNEKGLERCLTFCQRGYGPDAVGSVVSASEAHNLANLRRTIAESKADLERVARRALGAGLTFIGGVSTAFGCPIQGDVPVDDVLALARWYADLGVRKVLFGDTTGVGNPFQVEAVFEMIRERVPDLIPIAHFHNTRGTGLANCVAALRAGVTHFDSAVGGVGGRPKFTNGEYPVVSDYTGNVCTEDLVALFEEMGVRTGIDLDRLESVGRLAEEILGHELHSHTLRTGLRVKH